VSKKYKPKYICWWEENFAASPRVNRRLDWLERHIYRALCIQANFCASRPYLPVQDSELALLADVPAQVWDDHKENILAMFTKYDDPDTEEILGWSSERILDDWQKQMGKHEELVEQGRKGGRAAQARLKGGSRTEQNRTEPNGTELDGTQQNGTRRNGTLQKPDSTERKSTGQKPLGQVQEKPATTSLSDGGLDSDLDGDGSDGLEHGRGESGYSAQELLTYYYEHMPKFKLGVKASSDLQTMMKLKDEYGGKAIGLAMEWAFYKSDFWAKEGKGALAGVHGFAKAFHLILEQRTRWAETALKRKRG
jgi:hypothetical protein